MGLILFEFMSKSGKSLDDLIAEVYEIVGPFAFERIDLHIDNDTKIRIIEDCNLESLKSLVNIMLKELKKRMDISIFLMLILG